MESRPPDEKYKSIISLTHISDIMDRVTSCFQTQTFADVRILCENQTFLAHRLVLAAASPLLKEIFKVIRSRDIDLMVPDMYTKNLLCFLNLVYKGETLIMEADVPNLSDFVYNITLVSDVFTVYLVRKASPNVTLSDKMSTLFFPTEKQTFPLAENTCPLSERHKSELGVTGNRLDPIKQTQSIHSNPSSNEIANNIKSGACAEFPNGQKADSKEVVTIVIISDSEDNCSENDLEVRDDVKTRKQCHSDGGISHVEHDSELDTNAQKADEQTVTNSTKNRTDFRGKREGIVKYSNVVNRKVSTDKITNTKKSNNSKELVNTDPVDSTSENDLGIIDESVRECPVVITHKKYHSEDQISLSHAVHGSDQKAGKREVTDGLKSRNNFKRKKVNTVISDTSLYSVKITDRKKDGNGKRSEITTNNQKSVEVTKILNHDTKPTRIGVLKPIPVEPTTKILECSTTKTCLKTNDKNTNKNPKQSDSEVDANSESCHIGARSFHCEFCKKPFSCTCSMNIRVNAQTGHKTLFCDVCNDKFDKPYINQNSLSQTHSFSCDICKNSCPQESIQYEHTALHTEKQCACDVCNQVFCQHDKLVCHERINTGEKPFSCDICNKTYSHSAALKYHKKIHTREKSFSCDICNKTFSQTASLKYHKKIHTREKTFSCDVCNRTFSQSSSLKCHEKVHTGEKLFSCYVCKKTFENRDDLVHHRERYLSCDICDKKFCLSASLSKHKKIHSKVFSCDVCRKIVSSSNSLRRHKQLHTGEKPYSCDICDKAFSRTDQLFSHKKSHFL